MPETVWMVVSPYMDGGWVFSTKEKAEAFAAAKNQDDGFFKYEALEVHEEPLDPSPEDVESP